MPKKCSNSYIYIIEITQVTIVFSTNPDLILQLRPYWNLIGIVLPQNRNNNFLSNSAAELAASNGEEKKHTHLERSHFIVLSFFRVSTIGDTESLK